MMAALAVGYFIGLTGFAAMKRRGAHIREMLESGDLPLEQLMIEFHGGRDVFFFVCGLFVRQSCLANVITSEWRICRRDMPTHPSPRDAEDRLSLHDA